MFSDDKSYLNRLILQGEGENLDFKYHIADAEKIAVSLVAFANSSGGTLLIGVKDNGKVKGIQSDEEVYMIETAAGFYCKPDIQYTTEERMYDDKTVLVVNVQESTSKPHYAKDSTGRWMAYIRHEDKNLLANKVFIDVMNRKRKGHTTRIRYTEREQQLLRYLQEEEKTNVKQYAKHSGLPYRVVHNMIVDLVCIGVIKMNILPGTQFYSLAEEPDPEKMKQMNASGKEY